MESINKYLGKELNWTFVKNVGYVLHACDEQEKIAELNVQGTFGSKAEGKFDQENWKFKRAGLLKNNISVMDDKSNQEIALFKKKGLGGFLEIKHGKTFTIERNALMTEYRLFFDKQLFINYLLKENGPQVILQPSAARLAELPLLVVFLGYLVIMQRIDANFAMPF
jgi:hypothetical protein